MTQWNDPLFTETAIIIFAVLIILTTIFYPIRNKNSHTLAAWSSVQSWLIGATAMILVISAPPPWPLIGICIFSVLGLKDFFQITGMYHRGLFVWAAYLFVGVLGYAAYTGNNTLYNVTPMALLGTISLIPILQNNPKHMVQYMGLTILGFIFIGWSFLHAAWIFSLPTGVLIFLHISILSEVSDNISLAVSRLVGNRKLVDQITVRRTWEGLIASALVTVALGFALRHLLPDRREVFWIASSITAILVGGLGDMILSVIRRDLGVRDVGAFVFGRGQFLDRMDRMIFVTPVFYHMLLTLQKLFPNL